MVCGLDHSGSQPFNYNSQRQCQLYIKLHSLKTEFKAGMQVCMQCIAVCVLAIQATHNYATLAVSDVPRLCSGFARE